MALKEYRLKEIESLNGDFTFIKGNIADRALIDSLFDTYKFNIVVNLAAQAGVRYSITNPDVYIESNMIGFYNILEACRHHSVDHLVYASSSSVYGSNKKVPYSTDDKVDNPVSLYAATKKSNELFAHAYSKLYDIPSTGLRFFTVYGPAGRPDMAYFSFTNKLIKGETINLRGSVLPYYLMSGGCMGLKNGLYIFLIRQFFRNIPVDMEEAAYVDGCGTLKTFVRIMLPEAKPILTSCFLFAFVWQWTDGFYSKMFLGTTSLVSTVLARLVDSLGAYIQRLTGTLTTVSIAYSNCILATGTLMIIVPLIILYRFAQRAFVESISNSGIKM